MPSRHSCSTCDLTFEVGWFHYHDFQSGFAAMTLLVCTACGAQHAVEIALRPDGPEWLTVCEVRVLGVRTGAALPVLRLLRRDLQVTYEEGKARIAAPPFTVAKEVREEQARSIRGEYESAGAVMEIAATGQVRNPFWGPARQDRLLMRDSDAEWRELPANGPHADDHGRFDLADQTCGRCGKAGSFASDAPEESPARCPRCHERTLCRIESWVT